MRHRRPFSYQNEARGTVEVASAFRIVDSAVTFDLGPYDKAHPLVIDPRVVYSTPVIPCCLQALGADGSAYYGGSPSPGPVTDAVVQKLNPQGQLQFTVRMNSPQTMAGIAVDGSGAVYFNGQVDAGSPPPLVNAVRATPAAAYLAKVRADGSGFAFVTYYDGVTGPVTVAADGSIFIGGSRSNSMAVTKLDAAGNVVWTYDIAAAGTTAHITTAGTSVFAAGFGFSPYVMAAARIGAGANPGASAVVRSWNVAVDPGRDVNVSHTVVAPDGSGGGAYVLRTTVIATTAGGRGQLPAPCAVTATLTKLDVAWAETASTAVPALGCPEINPFADPIDGPASMAIATNGDVWVGGTDGEIGSPSIAVAFARRLPPALPAPAFAATSRMPRYPNAGRFPIRSLGTDPDGTLYTLTAGPDGNIARKTSMTSPAPAAAVSGLTASQAANGDSSVAVSWQATAGATGYQVWAYDSQGSPAVSRDVSGGQTTTVTLPVAPAAPLVTFSVVVRACANGFGDTFCGEASTAFAAVRATPQIVAPAAGATLTGSTVTFSWNIASGFFRHTLTLQRNGVQVLSDTYDAPLSTAFYSLPSGTYTVLLRSLDNFGQPYTSTRQFTIQLPPVPSASPAVQSANVTGGNTVTVNFPLVQGADLYLVQVIQPNTGPGGGALTVAARMVSALPVTLQIPAGPASVVVSACNGDGCAPHSAPVAINPAGPNPSVPVIASPAAGSYVAGPVVFFSWSRLPGDNGSNITYRLYVQDMERQFPAGNIYTRQNFWAMRLQPGKRYDAIVLAKVNGQDAVSAVANFVLSGPVVQSPTPVIPGYQETAVPRRQDGSIALAWAPVPGASSHQWILYPPSGAPIVSGLEFTDSHGVFGLPSGNYTGKVRACLAVPPAACAPDSDVGWGQWSDAAGTGPWLFTLQ